MLRPPRFAYPLLLLARPVLPLIPEWSAASAARPAGEGATTVGCEHDGPVVGIGSAISSGVWVMYLELRAGHVVPLDTLPKRAINLVVNNKIDEMKNSLLSGLSLLKRLLWSLLLPGSVLMSTVPGQRSFFCYTMDDLRLVTENETLRKLL